MLTKHTYLKKKIDQLISEQIEMLKDNLSLGSSNDYSDYMKVVGKIEGLRSALDLCEEAEKIVERDT